MSLFLCCIGCSENAAKSELKGGHNISNLYSLTQYVFVLVFMYIVALS